VARPGARKDPLAVEPPKSKCCPPASRTATWNLPRAKPRNPSRSAIPAIPAAVLAAAQDALLQPAAPDLPRTGAEKQFRSSHEPGRASPAPQSQRPWLSSPIRYWVVRWGCTTPACVAPPRRNRGSSLCRFSLRDAFRSSHTEWPRSLSRPRHLHLAHEIREQPQFRKRSP